MPHPFQLRPLNFADTLRRIQAAVYQPVAPLAVEAWVTPEPVSFSQRQSGAHRALKPGQAWGKLFDCAWFHFTGTVPAEAAGAHVVLMIDVNGEGLVVDSSGHALQGLTSVSSTFERQHGEPEKREVEVARTARGREGVDVWVDVGNNDLFGELKHGGALAQAEICIRHDEMKALFYDFEVLSELLPLLTQTSARAQRIKAKLYEAGNLLSRYTEDEARAARAVLAPELARRGGDASLRLSAIGHAHIDLAWLWPLREGVRKTARTFATALMMMERYPDYVFGSSQPQLYQWVKESYPSLYPKIKQRIREGRWEAQGAMWVEPDTNITGGESLVRQLLHGRRFFREEFGVETDQLWLPDVFGYTGSLPQLLKKSGIRYFMTQKLSWSLVNKFPHQTFWWEGIDGSRVLAHMLPEETYNGCAAPRAIHRAEHNFLDSAVCEQALLLFGIGDGGGGPGEEHLERLARERNLDGLAPVTQEFSKTFFARLDADSARAERYPLWRGELYLERHQGTLTTQARNKRFNRKLEYLLREVELSAAWAVQAAQGTEGDYRYPQEALDHIWREVLLYHFHDILPGSSITRVYDESLARYAILQRELEALLSEADEVWVGGGAEGEGRGADAGGSLVVVNSLSWPRREWLKVGDGDWRWVSVDSLGRALLAAEDADVAPSGVSVSVRVSEDGRQLENELLRVTFAADGSIASLFDKRAARETVAPGEAFNRLDLYVDKGDAWDIPIDFDQRPPVQPALVATEVFQDGPRAGVRHTYTHGASRFEQEVSLTSGAGRVEFHTRVDWQERDQMLRARFPVAVRAPDVVCDIQFGTIRRPVDNNTSWNAAMFEIAAHKWIDLSEPGYGVALLNDCKYGHRAKGHVMELTLLRSPCYPDPKADLARHEFAYAVYPHSGDHVEAQVMRAGYEFNIPLRVVEAPATAPESALLSSSSSLPAWLTIDSPAVIAETIKRGEDGDSIVVRLYESTGAHVRTAVRFGFPVKEVELVNLMEEDAQPLAITHAASGDAVELTFDPFEIVTLRIES
ncbi:alpha-mannosidase [Geminisphaera colitermitum]|uniref:alpha-mannosidase n=1 Tax=Geminisphaera colitermitum TaxID=1148786 RepID=UPI0005B79C85|nr:glycoside hydrolase family 38 C-terminal domain-containing protein [Geminisphaera colitermitum]